MRFWVDSDDAILTDDQVLNYVAAFGSLEDASAHGDIRLMADSPSQDARISRDGELNAARRMKFKDYLAE